MASSENDRIACNERNPATCLFDLPNEVLIHVLTCLDTLPLLQIRAVAHRFQNLIIRIIHARLLQAAALKDRKLILECYHPSAQYTEPYLYCDYLGTPGLSGHTAGLGSIYELADEHSGEGTLRKLYSRFRPTRNDPQQVSYYSHPAGDIPGSRTSERAAARSSMQTEAINQKVNLEADELFTQLQFIASLVEIGPRRGFFISIQNIVEQKTTRVFRTWLAERAKQTKVTETGRTKASPSGILGEDDSILWMDQNRVAGLKVRVQERGWRKNVPILLHRDEDQAVGYSLELQELLISTTHLMLAVEKSLHQREQDSGRAMVFGSFATANPQ
ncbi:hypothetical protein JMJ35_006117 [Cladonia borealis]|uniref:F-box domain-containing protein n=1 Tax=Cladonia borealis TaxID=184061 RepID=A0AA39V4N7_9LECA|nr:hypothetical protein JMJ35_006117 [Cladonia borealis]